MSVMGSIAEAKICRGGSMHIPDAVMRRLEATPGDTLEFYAGTDDFDLTRFDMNSMVVIRVQPVSDGRQDTDV